MTANEPASNDKAKRRSDRALLATYHEAKLAELLEHIRQGFAEYDAGRMNAFDLDDLIHHYNRGQAGPLEILHGFRRASLDRCPHAGICT